MECKKCGKEIGEEKEYCDKCNAEEPAASLKNGFNILYNIDEFDTLEEGRFKEKEKKKKILICISIIVAVLIVAFVGFNWVKNKTTAYDETHLNNESIAGNVQEPEITEEKESEENISTEDSGNVEGENNIDKLKEVVMRLCNKYNNGQPLYDGELIAVVKDRKTIKVTYHIPRPISVGEKDAVKKLEEDIKKEFLDKTKEQFPEEITVNIKTIVSYR